MESVAYSVTAPGVWLTGQECVRPNLRLVAMHASVGYIDILYPNTNHLHLYLCKLLVFFELLQQGLTGSEQVAERLPAVAPQLTPCHDH